MLRSVHQWPSVEHFSCVKTSNNRTCDDGQVECVKCCDRPFPPFEHSIKTSVSSPNSFWRISKQGEPIPEQEAVNCDGSCEMDTETVN